MVEVTDIRGVTLRLDRRPGRIVSLVPSLTETVADLGLRDAIVGCTVFCVEPEGVLDEVRKRGRIVGGPKDPDVAAIRALKPDLVLANREENRREDVALIEEFCSVHVSEPKSVDGALKLLDDLGVILGAEGEASKWAHRVNEARRDLNRIRSEKETRRFGYLVWWDPPMVVGGDTYISRLLEEGPFRNAFGELERYPRLTANDLANAAMDMVFAPTEPYRFDAEALEEVRGIAGAAPIMEIDGWVCSWHGTATARGLEYLCGYVDRLEEG